MSDGVTRRSALTATGIAAVGGVAGFVVASNSDAAKTAKGTTAANAYGDAPAQSGRRLAALADVPDGGGVILKKPAVVLTRQGADVRAFSAVCPHQGCLVQTVTSKSIDCPCHGSRFDPKTGDVLAGPAPRGLPRVVVTVRDGEVFSG
jgi:Rieske Fe-S protein